jgi:hypothetical protein
MKQEWRWVYRSFRAGHMVSQSKPFTNEADAKAAAKRYVSRYRSEGGFAEVWGGRLIGASFSNKQLCGSFGDTEALESYYQAMGV